MPLQPYDLEKVYDEQINPLMNQIIAICKEHKMPMFCSFAYASDGDGHDFCTTNLPVADRTPNPFKVAHDAIYHPHARVLAITVTGPKS